MHAAPHPDSANLRAVIRPARQAFAAALLGLVTACAHLPDGVPPAPADDPAAGTLTLPSGRTVAVYPDALSYSGQGRFRWPDGRVYEGDWLAGQPHGQGTEALPDGSRYQGGWRHGRRHGRGTLREADGSRYEGDFVDGLRDGRGILNNADGRYEGQWSEDVPHGEGAFDGSDGTRYQGDWSHGERFGFGTYTTTDGRVYRGDWAYDQPHGSGTMTGADGFSYEGEWRQGERHGYGRAEGPPGLVYEGTWRNGERHGFGRLIRPDGSRYEGEWQADARHGQGREERPDGSFHEGTWELNRPMGPGRRGSPSGIEISGLWNGETVSTGLLTLPTGLEFAGPLFDGNSARASARLLAWLQSAASHGDPYAALMLGTFHVDMEVPEPDLEIARRWLGVAAEAGIAEAQYRLAVSWEALNPPRVVELLAAAAEQDHPAANARLGEYYHQGTTVPRNLPRAIRYYERAMDRGSLLARNNLAWLLATADDPAVRDGPRAVALIRPVALYTGAWQYLDTLAAAWAAAGELQRAAATAEAALAAVGADPAPTALAERAALERRLDRYRQGQALYEFPR